MTLRPVRFALVFLLASGIAHAQARLAVVPLDGLGMDPALLEKLDTGLRAEVDKLGVASIKHDDVARAHRARPCDGDVGCLAALGKGLSATSVLAGSVGLAGDEVHVTLKIIDVPSGTVSKTLDASAPASQGARVVKSTAMRLLRPDEYNTSGGLLVNVKLSGAEIVVDGILRATTPLFGPVDGLTPGRRDVEVRYAGRKSWRGFVDVPFDEPARIELAEKGDALVLVPRASTAGGPKVQPADEVPVLTMVGAGVGIVGVAAGIGAIIAYTSADSAFRQGHDSGDVDPALIQQNQNASLAYGILLPVSLGCLVGGGGLLVFSLME